MDAIGIVFSLKGCESAQKWEYLASLSTTTMMILFPYDFAGTMIEYIEISHQQWLGMANGFRIPKVLIVSTLFYRQTKNSTANL